MADYNFLLETRLSPDQQLSLQVLQRVCRAAGLNLYLTGGPMRDLLTGKPVRFLEITTEGNPLGLAAELKATGAERISSNPEHRSLTFSLRGGRVRVSGARHSAAAEGTIVEDLRRRGLTLNSIGLSLNPGSRGLPLDPTNGVADIEARLIRMNGPYVFFEDPIVLLRAIRLRTRLEFSLEERTLARMEAARENEYLERASNAARGQEWEAIAYEPDPAAVLQALDNEHWLEAAFGKGVRAGKMNLAALTRLSGAIDNFEQLGFTLDAGLCATPFILGGLASSDQNRLSQLFPSRHLAEWKRVLSEARAFEKKLQALPAGSPEALWRVQELVEKTLPEAVVVAALDPTDAKSAAAKRLAEFQTAALQLRRRLPVNVLRAAGMAPRSIEGEEVLRPWYHRLLRGQPLSDAELLEGVRAAVLALHPPPAPIAVHDDVPKGRRGGRAAKSPAPQAKPVVVAPAAPPVPVAKPSAPPPKAVAPRPVAKPAAKPAKAPSAKLGKTVVKSSAPPAKKRPAPKAAPKHAVKPKAKAKANASKPRSKAKAAR